MPGLLRVMLRCSVAVAALLAPLGAQGTSAPPGAAAPAGQAPPPPPRDSLARPPAAPARLPAAPPLPADTLRSPAPAAPGYARADSARDTARPPPRV